MEPAKLFIHAAAAVSDRGDKDLTAQQLAAAEAALAVAAVGVDGDAGALQRDGHRLGGIGLDHILVDTADNRDVEGLLLCPL